MVRRTHVLGAGLLAVALAAGTGWVAQANDDGAAGQERQASVKAVDAIDGYQVVKLGNANVGNFQRRTVNCPAGKRAIGGGAEAQGNEAVLVGSFPTDGANGWVGIGRQPGSSSVGISVYVICANG
ncbi:MULTISPECIES: hypothetical protein [unclassified Kitasatospora]|uniref:hypothetical protein n=1 Tax=unclassified Kitasatospora TaxID=2633591 RepID=UPI002E307C6B|nr:hypothetical protein [Kitasatospora sp. NBC_01246]